MADQYLEYLIAKYLNKQNMFNMNSMFQLVALIENAREKFLVDTV
jgi:hypothetical protein